MLPPRCFGRVHPAPHAPDWLASLKDVRAEFPTDNVGALERSTDLTCRVLASRKANPGTGMWAKCGCRASQKRSNLYLFLDRTFVGPSSFASWIEPGRRYSTP